MTKNNIVSILVHMPLVFLFSAIMLLNPKEVPVYSYGILRFCIKEELLFRVIPFQYIERNAFNSLTVGIINGLFIQYFISSTSSFSFIVNNLFGVSYAMGRLRYSFIESIQFRYFLMAFLLAKKDVM